MHMVKQFLCNVLCYIEPESKCPSFFVYTAIILTFVQSSYTVSEGVGSLDIEITKENDTVSEQVLPVIIQLAPGGSATQGPV